MKRILEHTTLKGEVISLKGLDDEERRLLAEVRAFLKANQDWPTYGNFWMKKIGDLYDHRGVSRSVSRNSPLFRIAQDLGSRLAVKQGWARAPNPKPDYREQLSRLITEKFHTRRGFCQKTGISEDLLSHVLAGRKDFAIETLANALERIGYRIQIVPVNGKKSAAEKSA
jgi:hypothetical protein